MPPFEYDPAELFAAIVRLANERDQSWRFTKKGDRRPAYDVEAAMEAKRKKLKARQEAATERTLAAARKRNSTARPAGEDIARRMLRVMEPQKFYGMGDLMRLTGEARTSRGKVQEMLRRGWVEKAQNPAWSGVTLNPQKIMAGAEPHPRHLYRLSEAGCELRGRIR